MTTQAWVDNTIAKSSAAPLDGTEVVRVVDDPGGTPASKKATVANVKDYILALANTWTAKQTFTPPANTEAIVVSGYSLTGANAQSLADWSGTWNTSGTPTAFKINITDTASNSASLLMDLRVGGSSKFKISKVGAITVNPGSDITHTLCDVSHTAILEAGAMTFTAGGTQVLTFAGGRFGLNSSKKIDWNNDTFMGRDAANVVAQVNSTNAQTKRLYATFSSATDYHRSAWSTAKQTLSNVSGASVTATGLIPDGAIVVGVTTKVTTALGTSNGTTGYQVGDGSDVDRWGAITGTAAGTSSDNRDWTATTVQAFTAAQDVVITATGGNFDGTGAIEVTVHYLRGESD